jgi:hypothetical protein
MTLLAALLLAALLLATLALGAWPVAALAVAPPQIHTVAGGGSCSGPLILGGAVPLGLLSGGPCDGVSATSVPIANATSVAALPGGGFLYVDDTYDLVREVSPAGTVTTVAGNGTTTDVDGTLAVDSGLNGPVAVALLPSGGFLITEYDGSVVRMVSPGTPATAMITTIAGTGTPGSNGLAGQATSIQLNYPSDAVPTSDGQVLIADTYNDSVRLVSAASAGATISTIAGDGPCDAATTTCEGLPAVAVALDHPVSVSPIQGGSGGYLIAESDSEQFDDTIREVSQISPSGTFTTVAGTPGEQGYAGDGGPATAAQLNNPEQVVSTADGGFLIADTNNEVIRQVSASGTITTVAGDGVATYAGDGGPATSASLDSPAAVSPTTDGGFLIADAYNDVVREITIPAVSTISFSPASPDGHNGWYVNAVLATVTATEGAQISCELDPTAPPPVFAAILPASCAFSGAGAEITANGTHTLYAASVNAFGDDELPVSAVVKIDTTPPTMSCSATRSFPAGTRHAAVTATVVDQISGPVSSPVSSPASTAKLGSHVATLTGESNAGLTVNIKCKYTVVPLTLDPSPAITERFAANRQYTTLRRLVVSHVPAAAAVNVTCHGKACPFAGARNITGKKCKAKPCTAKKRKLGGRARAVDLTPLFAKLPLAVGTRLTVSVTAPNTIGRNWLFTIRAGKDPRDQMSCLAPGSSIPGKGCKSAS